MKVFGDTRDIQTTLATPSSGGESFGVSASSSTLWLAVSPILMTFLLLKVSGVALLEKSLASRSDEYRDYIRRTSAFIPWPPKCEHAGGNS